MSYAAVMVHVDTDEASDARIRLATSVADQFHATLIGIAACAPRVSLAMEGSIAAQEDKAALQQNTVQLAELEKTFRKLTNGARKPVEWRSALEFPADMIAREARAADLIVVGNKSTSGDSHRSLDPGALLLEAGRPVLVAPRSIVSLKPTRILVAWQDTRESRRALQDALPFVHLADEVLVVQICDEGTPETKHHLGDVAQYIARHRVMASAGVRLKASGTVADELIQLAEYEKVALIVAGAYGHSRIGERIFGGVTRDLLVRSPVCCLFSN